jgi:transcription initiation factor IIE alpha subunit
MTYSPTEATHIWICPECPAVLFEYYDSRNITELKERLK